MVAGSPCSSLQQAWTLWAELSTWVRVQRARCCERQQFVDPKSPYSTWEKFQSVNWSFSIQQSPFWITMKGTVVYKECLTNMCHKRILQVNIPVELWELFSQIESGCLTNILHSARNGTFCWCYFVYIIVHFCCWNESCSLHKVFTYRNTDIFNCYLSHKHCCLT